MTPPPLPGNTQVISRTQQWLASFVIEYNICPFAKREVENNRVQYVVDPEEDIESCLRMLIEACDFLESHPDVETTLVIYPAGFRDFLDFLDYLDLANELLIVQGYEGIFQLASFHPDYCFSETEPEDPSNYTNRSPWPMLHIIREASLENALAHYPEPEKIPERNIGLTRELGQPFLQQLLEALRKA